MTTALQLFNKLEKEDSNYGPLTMVIGDSDEANERIYDLDGMRVKDVDNNLRTGTIWAVYINRSTRRVRIGVNMDSGGTCYFRPRDLNIMRNLIEKVRNLIKKNRQ